MKKLQLSDLIEGYKERSGLSYTQISKRAKLPSRTIQSWAQGLSRRPRRWQDLVQFATAVDLNMHEIDQLLQLTSHPQIAQLKKRGIDFHLLEKWEGKSSVFQIPRKMSAFYRGRRDEQERIESILFDGEKLCVIQGMGGIGKTSLATKIGQNLMHRFPDGILWADMRVTGITEILDNWAQALGIELPNFTTPETRAANMWGILSRKVVLIILDDAISLSLTRLLLPSYQTPCSVIVTTRSKEVAHGLVTNSDNIISLAPMRLSTSLQIVQDALGEDAVNKNKDTVTKICELLGHLPLALNIFARRHRIRSKSLDVALEKLRNIKTRLHQLKISDEAVRTAFELSWEELDEELKESFQIMAVFLGRSFTLDAYAEISELDQSIAEDRLDQLNVQFLVDQAKDDNYRYRQHPLLAAWANEMLDSKSDYWLKMAYYFVRFADEQRDDYLSLLPDWQNVMAGMKAAFHLDEWNLVLRYMKTLYLTWTAQGHHTSARQGFAWAKHAAEQQQGNDLIFIFLNWGIACIEQAEYLEANEKLQNAFQCAISKDNMEFQGKIRFQMARIYIEQDDYQSANRELKNSWQCYQEVESLPGMADCLYQMGDLEYYRGNYVQVLVLAEDALALHIQLNNSIGQIQTLMLLATTAQELKDISKSREYMQQAKQLFDRVNDKAKQASYYYSSANLYRLEGKFEQAKADASLSLALFQQCGKLFSEVNVLNLIALIDLNWHEVRAHETRVIEATENVSKSLELSKKIHYDHGKASALLTLGKALKQANKVEEACESWEQALEDAKALNNEFLTARLEELMFEIDC